jgi:uncharacterized membrane protein
MTSSTGLPENVAAALSYLLGWVSGLIFLLVEQRSTFVRFHAMQSLMTFGGLAVIGLLLPFLPGLSTALAPILGLLSLILWILLIIKAWQGERYPLPWIGIQAQRQVDRMAPPR